MMPQAEGRYGDSLMRCAAVRHALAGLDPLQGRALAVLAEDAQRDPDLAAELLAGIRDAGRSAARDMASLDPRSAAALAAFRYCLGRMTHATAVCADVLWRSWGSLVPQVRAAIVAEAAGALAEGRAGMPCDEQAWRGVLDHAGAASPPRPCPPGVAAARG